MRKVILVLTLWLAVWTAAAAQAPAGFSFQAVVRDNSGQIATNRVVSVRISILQGGESGSEVYAENHSARTNSQGIVTLVIGEGSNASGSLTELDWKTGGPYFLRMEADANGGMDYQLVATTQLLSVPYALHARTAEEFDGTISFGQLTDVPETIGFSGSWNDLTDKPELFSGSWNDLTDVPETIGFSGEYDDLRGVPSISDSIVKYGFPGTWEALEGKPALFDGNYQSLNGRPSIRDSVEEFGFSGEWADLSGRPDFTGDSLEVWNGLLDYEKLKNKPALSEDGTFTGKYEDLSGKPDIEKIAGDEAQKRLDTLRYSSLKELPALKDTVVKYGFSGSYQDLEDVPDIEELVISDYNQLNNLPALRDTVLKYAPVQEESGVSSWNDLTDKPVLKDTVEKYGFSGQYSDLKGKPEGTGEGDILYWSNETWNVLPIGEEGQMLTVAGGKLTWIDASFTSTAANTYRVGEVYEENGKPAGVVVEVSSTGRYAKIASLTEYKAKWDAAGNDAATATGAASTTDGVANSTIIRNVEGYAEKYPVFGVLEDLGDGWYIPALEELELLYGAMSQANEHLAAEGATKIERSVYWSSTEMGNSSAYGYLMKDTTLQVEENEGGGEVFLTGGQLFEAGKQDEYAVRAFKQLTWAEATSKKDETKVWKVGDVYVNDTTSMPEGIVYKVDAGGRNCMVISYKEAENKTWSEAGTAFGDEWRLPTEEEMMDIFTQRHIINAAIENHLQGNAEAKPVSADSVRYWTSTEVTIEEENPDGEDLPAIETPGAMTAYVDAMGNCLSEERKQTETLKARAVKEIKN